jgi:hypothetical protein
MTVIRTQFSLDKQAHHAAKIEARRQGISLAEFLRRAVAVALGRRASGPARWMRHAGTLTSGDPDASVSVNQIVYRRPRR